MVLISLWAAREFRGEGELGVGGVAADRRGTEGEGGLGMWCGGEPSHGGTML
jgi:hypothetical protein